MVMTIKLWRSRRVSASGYTLRLFLAVLALLLTVLPANSQTNGQPITPPANPDAAALQLVPATGAVSTTLGVVEMPEVASLLQRAGFDARVVTQDQLNNGALDIFGLLMLNMERPLTVAGAAFVADFVGRGGRLIASSWGPAVAPRRQAAFPAYRLQETLCVRVTGWSADGNAYLRAADGTPAFRGLPPYLDVRVRATPLIEVLPGGRTAAVWVAEDVSRSGASDKRSPAIVFGPRSAYFALNLFAEALHSRQMVRLLANTVAVLLPGIRLDPGRVAAAELEATLREARRVAAVCQDPEGPALLAIAEERANVAQSLLAQVSAPMIALANATQGADPPLPDEDATNEERLFTLPPGSTTSPGSTPVPAPLPAGTLNTLYDAIQAAERVTLLEVPSRTTEVRGVLLPLSATPPSRFAIARLLDNLRAAGCNLVVPEVYSAGMTLAPGPNQDPRFLGHDPLASLLAEAAPRGIAVHAWISLLTAGPTTAKGGILASRPRWAAQTRNGVRYVSGGQQWLCPSQAEVRDAVCDAVRRTLANTAVQGVLLDGVDYGGMPEACFDPSCVALFRADTGRDPREPLRGAWEQEWLRWRRNRLDTLVRRVTRDIRVTRPGIRVHLAIAAATADPRIESLADWRMWARERWVDGVCPHSGTGIALSARKTAERVLRLAPSTRVMPIVDTARLRTARHAMALVTAIQEGGAAGMLFDLPMPVAEAWRNQLALGSFRRPAAFPW